MNWYEENIEEPIRPLVKLLRDNGINTTCSCGHDMYIEAGYIADESIFRTYNLVYYWLYEHDLPCTFKISWEVSVIDGCPFWSIRIDIDHKRG